MCAPAASAATGTSLQGSGSRRPLGQPENADELIVLRRQIAVEQAPRVRMCPSHWPSHLLSLHGPPLQDPDGREFALGQEVVGLTGVRTFVPVLRQEWRRRTDNAVYHERNPARVSPSRPPPGLSPVSPPRRGVAVPGRPPALAFRQCRDGRGYLGRGPAARLNVCLGTGSVAEQRQEGQQETGRQVRQAATRRRWPTASCEACRLY